MIATMHGQVTYSSFLSFKLSFFPGPQYLMASSPSSVHECILKVAMQALDRDLYNIPVSKDIVSFEALPNHFHESDSLYAVPDLAIRMWSRNRKGVRSARTIWMLESEFSQSDTDMMDKLWEYIRDLPHLLVVSKILIRQAIPYHKPTPNSAMTAQLWEARLMDEGQFVGNFGSSTGYSQIVASGHPWLSLKSVEIHVWTCEPGRGPINVDSSHQAGYAFRVHIYECFWH